jgi:hypothetical protein
MKLYHISQNKVRGYDTYSDAVVCAESEEDAKTIHPNGWSDLPPWNEGFRGCWCDLAEEVKAKYLGEACEGIERGIICASFHAG